jgi:hypothetical protein
VQLWRLPKRDLGIAWDAAAPEQSGVAQYSPALTSQPPRLVVATPRLDLRGYLEELAPLLGRIASLDARNGYRTAERRLLAYLSCVGRRTDALVRDAGEGSFTKAAVYRYDLTRFRSPQADDFCAS